MHIRLIFVFGLLAVMPLERTFSQSPGEGSLLSVLFKRHDGNRDGVITKPEAQGQIKDRFESIDTNKDGEIDEAELRKLVERLQRRTRGANASNRPPAVPSDIEFEIDIAYRDGHPKWKLDLAYPKEPSKALRPGLVVIHGGGWRSGDKGGGQWRALPIEYAKKGYVCISVNYRFTDEGSIADCIADCKCAVRWLRANAKKYDVDPDRIGAYGNSAGAHLVSMLGLSAKDAELEGDGPYKEHSSAVQAVCCSATPTSFMQWGGAKQNQGNALNRLFKGLPVDTWKRKASPVHHVSADAPPFLIIHGTKDTTVPVKHGDELNQLLKKAGVKDVTYIRIDGAGHGVFGKHGDRTGPAMEAFFGRVLGQPRAKSTSGSAVPESSRD